MSWNKILAVVFFGGMLLLASCNYANAQTSRVCNDRSVILEGLEARWGEVITAQGIFDGNGRMLEILVSPDGTFTIITTSTTGTSCILGTGSSWQLRTPTILDGVPLSAPVI